jgi:hypothetical protein
VPSLSTVRIRLNETARPALFARRIWYGYGFFDQDPQGKELREYGAWNCHNRMGQSFTINCGHAGKLVGLYAYNEHCEPPIFVLEPNVYIQLTAGFIRGRYRFDELLELWPKHCRHMGLYDYFSVWLWDFDRFPGGNGGNIPSLRRQIPRYAAQGTTSLDCESGCNWGLHGRGYYIASHLMWQPHTDVDASLADFYEKAFGPAAASVRRYYERFDPGSNPLLSEHLLALGFRDLDEASRLAANRADVQARLDHLKQYLRYIDLRWRIDRASAKEQKKALTLAALTHVYRTRYSYMNHWEAMRQEWTRQAAQEFGEPAWDFKAPNYLAASPGALLLPRELAKRDGREILGPVRPTRAP